MSTATEHQMFPCRYCDLPAATCLDILDTDGGYCCPGCENDDACGIPSAVTHPAGKPWVEA